MSQIERRALLGAVGLMGVAAATKLAQAGSLNPPPGPVTPTMKPLTDVEPRTAVQSLGGDSGSLYVISQPGSYYLTGPINGASGKNGIAITVPNVALDLCGFPMLGVPGSLAGIVSANPNGNLIVRNGIVRAWGGAGVDLSGNFDSFVCEIVSANNGGVGIAVGDACTVRDCVSRDNGNTCIATSYNCTVSRCTAIGSVNGNGILIGPNSEVADCAANFNKLDGIGASSDVVIARSSAAQNLTNGIQTADRSRVVDCIANQNGQVGILVGSNCSIAGCTAVANTGSGVSTSFGTGISCAQACVVSDCAASGNTGNGIVTDYGSTIRGCTAQANTRAGIIGYTGVIISGNAVYLNGGDGIRVTGNALIERNSASHNGNSVAGSAGIHSTLFGNNRIVGNHCTTNTTGILTDNPLSDFTVGNSSTGNSVANYSPSSGVNFGPITTASSATATAWANF